MNRDTRRTRFTLGVLVVVAFTLITVDVRGGESSPLRPLRDFGATVFGPFERLVSAVVHPVSGFFGNIGDFGDQKEEIDRLRTENEQLRRTLATSGLEQNRIGEVDKLLRVAGLAQYRIVPARVIAVGSVQGFSWTVTIDAGARDGIKRDQTIINGDGLVGRVTTVGRSTATVLLANDPTSSVGARLSPTEEIGIVSGHGRQPMTLQLLNGQATMKPGDRLVTFGSQGGRPFVAGVPIGVVERIQQTPGSLTRTATLKPYANFTALDTVGAVIEPPRTNPRDALLPPLPSPRPDPVKPAQQAGTPSPSGAPSGPSGGPSARGERGESASRVPGGR
jgi:rod shape-determining protein MreC